MTKVAEYRKKAAELAAKAQHELRPAMRAELEALATSYLRLAEQAERNARTDIVYEPATQQPAQQQQQQQPQKKPGEK